MKYLVIIVIIIIAVVGVFLYRGWGGLSINSSPSVSPTTNGSNSIKTFTSSNLGISFEYNTEPEPANTMESGNKVYVFVTGTQPDKGQSIEVFTKNRNETFEASIRRQILADYPSKDCKIVVTPSNIQGGYQVAEITYPASDPSQPYFINSNLCNPKYDQTNGIRYFLYDPSHPDKFAFLDIGQYAILAHDNIPWQNTVIFIK